MINLWMRRSQSKAARPLSHRECICSFILCAEVLHYIIGIIQTCWLYLLWTNSCLGIQGHRYICNVCCLYARASSRKSSSYHHIPTASVSLSLAHRTMCISTAVLYPNASRMRRLSATYLLIWRVCTSGLERAPCE